jgi:hypothetical protein
MPLVDLKVQTSNNEDWIDSIVYYVDTGVTPPTDQLDIRGIIFEMEVRRSATDHEVVLSASTENGTIEVGMPPDFGFFLFQIPVTQMVNLPAADTYVGDIVGRDMFFTRQIMTIELTIIEGITKQPVVLD